MSEAREATSKSHKTAMTLRSRIQSAWSPCCSVDSRISLASPGSLERRESPCPAPQSLSLGALVRDKQALPS